MAVQREARTAVSGATNLKVQGMVNRSGEGNMVLHVITNDVVSYDLLDKPLDN